VSAGPDLRGGRIDKLGAGDGESCFITVLEVIYSWLYIFIRAAISVIFCLFFTK
jgi:hypothetical protein